MMFKRIATIWMAAWLTISFLCLLAGVAGLAIIPDARPSPQEFPARFVIFGILSLCVAIPGWVVAMTTEK